MSCSRRTSAVLSAVLVLWAAAVAPGVVSAGNEVMALSQDANNWVMWGRTYDGQRYSPLDQINKDNVGNLQVAWTFSAGVLRGHEGGPLVIGDTMWIHTPFPNKVFSINLPDQSINWIYEPKRDAAETVPVMCCDTVYRGLAYADGKIFLQQADTILVALDANTGERLWSTVNGDPTKGSTNTNAPIVVGDKVYTGISGGEFGVRGFLAAYNINDGSLVWKAYSTGPDDEMLIDPENTMSMGKPVGKDSSLNTWKGDQWKIGGGTTWGWYTYDPKLESIVHAERTGSGALTVFARDGESGIAKWVARMDPHSEIDHDGDIDSILAEVRIDGEVRWVLVFLVGQGSGFVIDRASGKVVGSHGFDPAMDRAGDYLQTALDLYANLWRIEHRCPPGMTLSAFAESPARWKTESAAGVTGDSTLVRAEIEQLVERLRDLVGAGSAPPAVGRDALERLVERMREAMARTSEARHVTHGDVHGYGCVPQESIDGDHEFDWRGGVVVIADSCPTPSSDLCPQVDGLLVDLGISCTCRCGWLACGLTVELPDIDLDELVTKPPVQWPEIVDIELEFPPPPVVSRYSTRWHGEDVNTTDVCPAALGSKDQQLAAFSSDTGLFYVPTNHVCMDYEPFYVEYVAGQPYVGATLSMFPAGRVLGDGTDNLGNFIAWDAAKGEIVWSIPEPFSVWSGALATGGGVVFYSTLEGYLVAVDADNGNELYRFKTPSGIIGNVNTWTHGSKQYIGTLSGVGGWAGIGMAAGLEGDTDGLGAVGAYRGLNKHSQLAGVLTVLALPD